MNGGVDSSVAAALVRGQGFEVVGVTRQLRGCRVRFNRPLRAVAPGQAVVFFSGVRVLGGGWIDRSKQ